MNGFIIGTAVQQVTGASFVEQFQHETPLVFLLSGLLTYASYKTDDVSVDSLQKKPFTEGIETLNGRIAMLGMLAAFCN